MAKKKTKRLPRKLSSLLDLAVTDAMALERSKRYKLTMYTWHAPSVFDPKECRVCMAGSVMARSLGAGHGESLSPSNFSRPASRKLLAINVMRDGGFSEAARLVGVRRGREFSETAMRAEAAVRRSYGRCGDGRAEWSDYREAAEILRKAGL